MITRVMCVGPGRLNETMATLSFDYNLFPQCDKTILISPYPQKEFFNLFYEFDINQDNFTIINDDYFDQYYDTSRWATNWYKQQILKLCALDHFDSEYFLIQDCDIVLLHPYNMFVDGKLNFKVEPLWNSYQYVYGDMVEKILGIKRIIQGSLVNELMPYAKKDWLELAAHIEKKHDAKFYYAICDVRPFHDKWFSEYELLGIWKTNQTDWTYFMNPSQPKIDSWEEFYNFNWKNCPTVKFHSPPLKYMGVKETKRLVKFLRGLV